MKTTREKIGQALGERIRLRRIQRAKLKPEDEVPHGNFGISVSLRGDLLAAGADLTHGAVPRAGAVYMLARQDGNWVEQAKLLAVDGQTFDSLGFSVSLDADTVLTGAPFVADHGEGSGGAYVFRLFPDDSIPAAGPLGVALLLLAMLAGGAYFIRPL